MGVTVGDIVLVGVVVGKGVAVGVAVNHVPVGEGVGVVRQVILTVSR